MTQYRIYLGCPGPSFMFGALRGILMASQNHLVNRQNSAAPAGNFDALWCEALNEFEAGTCTHFAMIHSDITPEPHWLDVLVEEMEKHKVGLISAAIAIKDYRGLTSCGIGDPDDNWSPLRRVTVKELEALPDTFGAKDLMGLWGGHHCLLNNNGLWLADLRFEEWRKTDDKGNLLCTFNFPRRNRRDVNGKWGTEGESEDWYFSRMAHSLGIPSRITKRVKVSHRGSNDFPNFGGWGQNEVDEDTRPKWTNRLEAKPNGVKKEEVAV